MRLPGALRSPETLLSLYPIPGCDQQKETELKPEPASSPFLEQRCGR